MIWLLPVALIVAAVWLIAAFGLFFMKKWGYYLAIILGILSFFTLISLVIVIYLVASDVKYEFE